MEGRPLILGGVRIPFDQGIERPFGRGRALSRGFATRFSGAAALGDIGEHFPDTDTRFKDADSLRLLAEVGAKIRAKGYSIVNVDATVIAEAPKLSAFKRRMAENLANGAGNSRRRTCPSRPRPTRVLTRPDGARPSPCSRSRALQSVRP